MDCSNTLSDAQLEAMFGTTDKEMGHIEQSMDCPIERTQRKYKRCVKFFSKEAALKQHHSPIKKKKCPHYGKTTICANDLEKHLRSCEKAPIHPAKWQLH